MDNAEARRVVEAIIAEVLACPSCSKRMERAHMELILYGRTLAPTPCEKHSG